MIEKFKRWADKQGWFLCRERVETVLHEDGKRAHLRFILPDGEIRNLIIWADGLIEEKL